MGHAFLLDGIEHTVGRELGQHAAAHAPEQWHEAQARAADVGARHRHHDYLVVAPECPGQLRFPGWTAQTEQVVVAQLHPLGVSGGARGVELKDRIFGVALCEFSGHAAVDPGPGLVDRKHALDMGQYQCRGARIIRKAVVGKEQLGLGVVDDGVPLGRRQAPTYRHHHHTDACGTEEQREVQYSTEFFPSQAMRSPR
jgi:hypothetical protein